MVCLHRAKQYMMTGKPAGQSAASEPSKCSDSNAQRENETKSKGPLPLVCQLCHSRGETDCPRRKRNACQKSKGDLPFNRKQDGSRRKHYAGQQKTGEQNGTQTESSSQLARRNCAGKVSNSHSACKQAECLFRVAMSDQKKIEEKEVDRQAQVKKKEAARKTQNCRAS